jgi:uncharacterized protein
LRSPSLSIPKDLVGVSSALDDWSILLAYRGSIAHGMYVPSSNPDSIDDKDLMGVCVPPIDYYLGVHSGLSSDHAFPANGTLEIKRDEWDIVVYDARKFIKLLAQGNPNVLAMLWLEENHYLKISEAGRLILKNRDLFVGRHVYKSFVGYAHGQLHRMTHAAFEGYMGAKRKALVEKHGFDCKNAAHLIRLLRMGAEFLKDGELNVLRHDAPQLLEIKRGEWSLEKVLAEADHGFKIAEQAYQLSTLAKGPDMKAVNKLSVEVIELALGIRHNG